MEAKPNLLVLHCPAGGGHKAAADAIVQAALARGVRAEAASALAHTPPAFERAYVGLHLASTERAPALYGRSYAALDQRTPLDGLRAMLDGKLARSLRRFVAERAPDAIVATHFFPLSVLGRERRLGRLFVPLVGVVTDYAAHAFWAEGGVDLFCAPEAAGQDLVRHGVAGSSIEATGIPVRPAFGRLPPFLLPAPGEPLRVLLTSGGFGVGPLVSALRSFSGLSGPGGAGIELFVVCGQNPGRKAEAEGLVRKLGLRARVVGFEPDMARRMAEAHVVVSKPGGLTLSEALAAGRPFFSVGACPGQEAKNEVFAVRAGAARSAPPAEVGPALAAAFASGALPGMAARARALSAPRAADAVVDAALAWPRKAGRRAA